MTALLIYPTHQNCREAVKEYRAAEISAEVFPGRTTEDSPEMSRNCWNSDADRAEAMGFPVVKTICFRCAHREKCMTIGYLGQLTDAKKADVVFCTHKRAECAGLDAVMQGRRYVSIHECPIGILRPALVISDQDLRLIQRLVDSCVKDPTILDWFANDLRYDDEGNPYHDDEKAIRRNRIWSYCLHLNDVIDSLIGALDDAEESQEWTPGESMKSPQGVESFLFGVTRRSQVTFQGRPWQFALVAASGKLHSAAILIDERFEKGGGQGNSFKRKSVVGFRDNPPSSNAVTWFNDATLDRSRLEMVLNLPVADQTPGARIENQKKAVQVLRDITRGTSGRIFSNILRGVLSDRSQFERVGLICHRSHLDASTALGGRFDRRIVKSTYFGSGEDRSSNDWIEHCDLIVIAGTPRIPPCAIATYLVQVGEVGAACRQPEWGKVYWEGLTESGEAVRVESRGYQEESWRRAHRDLVRTRLVQAIGRGRGILTTGCEVVVLSTEECGLAISDAGLESLTGNSTRILAAMDQLTIQNPNNRLLGKCIVRTRDVANETGFNEVYVRALLRGLERRGLVRKVGERGGWALVNQEEAAHAS